MANIKLVKLVSGLEFIGDYYSGTPDSICMRAAFQVVVHQVNPKQFSLGLAPISVAAKDGAKGLNVVVHMTHLLGPPFEPTTELHETYCKLTGAVIIPPPTPLYG